MHHHGPSVLPGPVTYARPWWTEGDLDAMNPDATSGRAAASSDHCPASRPDENAPIREGLIERVRREIANGTYETPEKWDIALDRLLDQLEKKAN